MSKSANELLTEWGIWVWEGIPSLSAKSSMMLVLRDNVEQVYRRSSNISDEDAQRIDRFIRDLRSYNDDMGCCLGLEYASGRTQEEIGRLLGLKRNKVREYVLQGVLYIEGRLHERQDA